MGNNYMFETRRRCNNDCSNRWFDNRGPYDRRLSPRRDRFDRYDRFDGRSRYDFDDYRRRHGACCHRQRPTSYRRSIFDYRY